MNKQECPLMFFQKNISWDLKLNERLKVNKTICLIFDLTFSFFTSTFIFHFSIIIFIDHAHWRFVYHIVTFIWASYSIFSKSHTLIDWLVKSKWKKKEDEASEMKINSTLCFSSLLLSIQYADYIINLHR